MGDPYLYEVEYDKHADFELGGESEENILIEIIESEGNRNK